MQTSEADLKAEVRKRTCQLCAEGKLPARNIGIGWGVRHISDHPFANVASAPLCTANDSLADWVVALVTSAAHRGEVNGAEAMRADCAALMIWLAFALECCDSHDEYQEAQVIRPLAKKIESLPLPTPISDYLTEQLTEARAAQRESDAQKCDAHAENMYRHGENALAEQSRGDAAAIRANVTPADAQYIERVRAEAALESAQWFVENINLDSDRELVDERITQLSQQAGKR